MCFDLGLQLGDLAVRQCEHVDAGEKPRWWRHLRSELHHRPRELVGVAGLTAVLGLPPLALRRAALGVVVDRDVGPDQRLRAGKTGAEEIRG